MERVRAKFVGCQVMLWAAVLFMVLPALSVLAAEKGGGPAPSTAPRLFLEPIAGFTTTRHLAPSQTAIPLGTVLELFLDVPEDAQVTFSGATITSRTAEGIKATCLLNQEGPAIIAAICEMSDGARYTAACELDVVSIAIGDISATVTTPTVVPFDLDEYATNEETMSAYFGESIADLVETTQGVTGVVGLDGGRRRARFAPVNRRFRTSIFRRINFHADVHPPAFAALMEWRFDGLARALGAERKQTFTSVGEHTVSVGPPSRSAEVVIDTYSVYITSHRDQVDVVEAGESIIFEAVTDPPGLESKITWLSSTKYGTASPVVGYGSTFVVRFEDAWGVNDARDAFQWLGVRADNALFGQDQKCGTLVVCGACCTGPSFCTVEPFSACETRGGFYHGDDTTCGSDLNSNNAPDGCESDDNGNGIPDNCDISDGTSQDCNDNGVPDETEPDCNSNGTPDECDITAGTDDCNLNGVPDSCDLSGGTSQDCDGGGVPDECDIAGCGAGVTSCADCNQNGIPDECDIAQGGSDDCNSNGVPDECERCLILGDMNGDTAVNADDEPDFDDCLAQACAPAECLCADMDGDADVDGDDETLFDAILAGQTEPQRMAIAGFNPRTGPPGTQITVDGVRFLDRVCSISGESCFQDEDCPPGETCDVLPADLADYCVIAMSPDGQTVIPFHVLSVTDNQLVAEVGAQVPGDQPGFLHIAKGAGQFTPIPAPPGTEIPVDPWIWTFGGAGIAQFEAFPWTPIPEPCGIVRGELANDDLCLTIEKACPKGTKLKIDARAWDHTPDPNFGVDGSIPCLEFTEDKNANQCALAICDAIIDLYAANSVTIDCFVGPGDPSGIKITLSYPARPITWGRFSITGPRIEIQVNNTSATNDDYVCWAPTVARARITGLTALAMDPVVVLTNDDPNDIPFGGDVLFADYSDSATWPTSWPVDTTALAETLTLTLPADGSWNQFVIAGKFFKPSVKDKDAVIDVHQGTENGPVCCTHPLMVRVRKNGNNLSPCEQKRYTQAILDLHAAADYVVYQQIHAIAWNQGHGGTQFLSWHRAYVLEYERALQGEDPSVAANYWNWTSAATEIFGDQMLGENRVTPHADAGEVYNGPFATWSIQGNSPIRRSSARDHQNKPPGLASDTTVLAPATYALFKVMEGNPHGSAHGWVGGWMGSIATAVRDPLFFMLHSNVERLWAKWQSRGHRGAALNEYDAQGSYSCASTFVKGAHLDDTMWPWNGVTGPGACTSTLDDRPATAPGGTLLPPAAPGFMLGPPNMPTPRDIIDYEGRVDPTEGLGFCYDCMPYCFGTCTAGAYTDDPACPIDGISATTYLKNDPIAIRLCGDCFGECVNHGYCDNVDPTCCVDPGNCVCYDADQPVSKLLCGPCFGECISGSYCDNPDCCIDPGNCVCYVPEHPISQQLCCDD